MRNRRLPCRYPVRLMFAVCMRQSPNARMEHGRTKRSSLRRGLLAGTAVEVAGSKYNPTVLCQSNRDQTYSFNMRFGKCAVWLRKVSVKFRHLIDHKMPWFATAGNGRDFDMGTGQKQIRII